MVEDQAKKLREMVSNQQTTRAQEVEDDIRNGICAWVECKNKRVNDSDFCNVHA